MDIVWKIGNGPVLIEPNLHGDSRGYFFESFNKEEFEKKTGYKVEFVQDNESMSSYGVLRGLHFQNPPYAQAKLVRVVKGAAVDIIVDIRKGSPHYGEFYTAFLSEDNHRQFFVPRGFAHGFVSLMDNTIFQYKCDNYYNKESEGGISWNTSLPCSEMGIPWEKYVSFKNMKLSDKDMDHPDLSNFDSPFIYEGEDGTIDEQ